MQITSVPTIVVGPQVFRGTPTVDELRHAIDQLERQESEAPSSTAAPS